MKTSPLGILSLACCAGLALLCTAAAADFAPGALISDTFSLKAGSREAGSPLGGQKTEVGGAVWSAGSSLVFTADGGITTSGENGVPGLVAIPLVTKMTTIQAEIDPAKSGWVALVFSASANPDSFWDSLQLLVTLQSSGNYMLYSDGVKNTLAKGSSTANGGQKAHVELSYDPGANVVTVKINGTTVADKVSLGSFKPRITAAGFRFQEPLEANGPMLKNFAVTSGK